VNVKKTILALALIALALVSIACSGSDATPTRTRVAEALPTQTPWVIYVPVTVTPGPATATLEPTVTPSGPQPTATKPPATARPAQPTKPPRTAPPAATAAPTDAGPPSPAPPTATTAPSCGQAYQVTKLTFPENGAKRRARPGGGAGATIQFKWDPIAGYDLDPKIGYRVNISTPKNSAALYISHNAYLKEQVAILNQQATYGLTNGDDATATWTVDVIMTDGEFNDVGDDTQPPVGTISTCGPTSPPFTIQLAVQ